jgi:hypothetical protein
MKVENKNDNFENDGVSRLLGSLNRVDAPGDFDFRVRARVAAGRPSVPAAWLPISARVAAVVALLLVVAGYFGLRSFRSPAVNEASLATVTVSEQPIAGRQAETANREIVVVPVTQPSDNIASAPRIADATKPKVPDTAKTKVPADKTGGSFVEAQRIANVMSLRRANAEHKQAATKKVLADIGVDANYSGSTWTVGEVKQNSSAERSGLKTGDVIESVKNKAVRVRRDGKVVQVELKP